MALRAEQNDGRNLINSHSVKTWRNEADLNPNDDWEKEIVNLAFTYQIEPEIVDKTNSRQIVKDPGKSLGAEIQLRGKFFCQKIFFLYTLFSRI